MWEEVVSSGGYPHCYPQVWITWQQSCKDSMKKIGGDVMADRYSGHSEHTLDAKGRVIIPAKFRDQLGARIAIMRGDRCIELYSQNEWNAVYQKYEDVDKDSDKKAYDRMRRLLFTSEENNTADKQGRLLVPGHLREYAKLDKDVIVSGAGRHVEVWDKQAFYEFIMEQEE